MRYRQKIAADSPTAASGPGWHNQQEMPPARPEIT